MGFLSALLGLLSGRHGSVCIVDFGHGLAPSTGIYPRELKPADLSIISGPKTIPLLLTSDIGFKHQTSPETRRKNHRTVPSSQTTESRKELGDATRPRGYHVRRAKVHRSAGTLH